MATKAKKQASTTPEEKALKDFNDSHKGKELTDKQKDQKKTLAEAAAKARFVRVFNKRFPKARAAIKGIAALGAKQYARTDVQVKAICATLQADLDECRAALGGKKGGSDGFVLPGFEEAKQDEKHATK